MYYGRFMIGPPDVSCWSGWHCVRADFGGKGPAPVVAARQTHTVQHQSGNRLYPDNPLDFLLHFLALRRFHGSTMRIRASRTPGANGQKFVQLWFAWITLRLNWADRDQENPCFQSGSASFKSFLQPDIKVKDLSRHRGERPMADPRFSGDIPGDER